jgi:hypothetical protein
MKHETDEIKRAIARLSDQSVRMLDKQFDLSEKTKDRIYRSALRRTGVKEKEVNDSALRRHSPSRTVNYGFNVKKLVMAAAAILLAVSIGTGAIVGAGRLSKSFGQFFRTLPEENYQGILFDIDQTQTSNGVTVTLSQGMCDGYVLYVIERIDFDASVTLTDEMFGSADGDCNAPHWYDEVVVNPKYPRYCASSRNYRKLIDHDAHSMTWLRTFGSTGAGDEIFGFFTAGSSYVLNAHDLYNMPDNQTRECSFQFEIHITRSEPAVYNLPDETFKLDKQFLEDCFDIAPPLDYDFIPDVWINPWFMEIVPATQNGKILNTGLKSDRPALVITLKNGRQYTEQNGIGWAGHSTLTRDMFGADYNKYEGFYLTFNEEIDITSIKSITLYGHELIKATLPDSVYDEKNSSVKKELPADDPIKVSGRSRTVKVTEIKQTKKRYKEVPAGTLQYSVKRIGVYEHLYETGASSKDVLQSWKIVSGFEYYDDQKEHHNQSFTDAFNSKTGKLNEGFYLVEYEIELTNVDSSLSVFDDSIFRLLTYCNYTEEYGRSDCLVGVPQAYILEHDPEPSGDNDTFTLKKGQTRTLHVGFIVNDNHRGSLSQIGLSVGSALEDDLDFVNMTKAVENLKK